MGKSITTCAVVLSVKASGENNSLVSFYTKDEGLLYATMYGGAKSRFKSLVSTWNSGILYLSQSNKQKFYKINDFDVKNYHLSFRENLLKMWSASLAAQILIKTKCAGERELCWSLFTGFIDGLELCTTDEQCEMGLIRFLWRFIGLLGVSPDEEMCKKSGLSSEALKYLVAISNLTAKEVRNLELSKSCVKELKSFLFEITENACGTKLSCMEQLW